MSDQTSLMVADQAELSIEEVRQQVTKIQQLMKSVMREGEHYGTIPGTDKPSLYKSGAEKLGFTFRLMPDFKVTRRDLPDGHREYEVICTLKHMQTGKVVGQGVGNCSTLESKYRYRYSEKNTGKPVPEDYWKIREKNPKGAQRLLGGYGYRARKIDDQWVIVTQGERVENPDIADCYNTVMKMAKKRAHVDAMITACAASDIFAQDFEDFIDQGGSGSGQKSPETGQKQGKKGEKDAKKGENEKIKDPIRQDLINEIGEIMKSLLFTDEERDRVREEIRKAADNKKLVGIKQQCRKVLGIREDQTAEDPELDLTGNEGWEAAGKKPESGGSER
jgi:hypothetical protein